MSMPGLVDECVYTGEGDWDYAYNEIYWGDSRSPKEQWCVECGCKIPPLRKHNLFIGVIEGSYDENGKEEKIRTCKICDKIINEFSSGSRSFGSFWEYFYEITGIEGPDQDPKDMEDFDEDEDDERERAEYLLGKMK